MNGEEEDSPAEPMETGDDFSGYASMIGGGLTVVVDCDDTFSTNPNVVEYGGAPVKEAPLPKAGILDFNPDEIYNAPIFSEPETIEAMNRLGHIPEELIVSRTGDFESGDPLLTMKVLAELDKRRKQIIANIIKERNRIVSGESAPVGSKSKPPPRPKIKRRKKKKKRVSTTAKRRKKTKAQEKTALKRVAAKDRGRAKQAERRLQEVELARSSKLREMKKERDAKEQKAVKARMKLHDAKLTMARAALKKSKEVDRRRSQLKKEANAELKRKAAERERRLQAVAKERAKQEKEREKKIMAGLRKADRQSRLAIEDKTKKRTLAERIKRRGKIVIPVIVPRS